MGYQKLQVGRATSMNKLLSDTKDLVNLNNVISSGTITSASGGAGKLLNDSAATFITNGISQGDVIANTSAMPNCTIVAKVVSETQLLLEEDITLAGSATYEVLSKSTEAAVLYIGTTSTTPTLKVRTMGGDDITFTNPIAGSFLPVQVVRVYNTGTADVSDILALF
jgi:hypothetical protein